MILFNKLNFTKNEIKYILNEQTHASVWASHIKYNLFTKKMRIEGPVDAMEISLVTGVGIYYDLDFDGCSSDKSYSFKIIRLSNNLLKINKI